MLTAIIFILGVSFLLYTLLGGADFGAGIIETFAAEKEEGTITKAIAPVWEANHVWLILAIVILFSGFPSVYSTLSVSLHIPLMVVLLGIIFRGTAFTFRHYDVIHDHTHKYYGFLFKASSFITPLFLGITLGAMILGRITIERVGGFYEIFIAPWLNGFCFTTGCFTVSLFGYIASVFLIGETRNDRERRKYSMFSKMFMISTMILGLLVFVAAEMEGHQLLQKFISSHYSILMLSIVLVSCPVIWILSQRKNNKSVYLRLTIGVQVAAVLLGWFIIQFPLIIQFSNGQSLTFYNSQAPPASLLQLLIALIVGLVLVVPAFLVLFRVFKVGS